MTTSTSLRMKQLGVSKFPQPPATKYGDASHIKYFLVCYAATIAQIAFHTSEVVFALLLLVPPDVVTTASLAQNGSAEWTAPLYDTLALGGTLGYVCAGLTLALVALKVVVNLYWDGYRTLKSGLLEKIMLSQPARRMSEIAGYKQFRLFQAIERRFSLDEVGAMWIQTSVPEWKRFLLLRVPRFALNAHLVRSYVRYVGLVRQEVAPVPAQPVLMFASCVIGLQMLTFGVEVVGRCVALVLYAVRTRGILRFSQQPTVRVYLCAAIHRYALNICRPRMGNNSDNPRQTVNVLGESITRTSNNGNNEDNNQYDVEQASSYFSAHDASPQTSSPSRTPVAFSSSSNSSHATPQGDKPRASWSNYFTTTTNWPYIDLALTSPSRRKSRSAPTTPADENPRFRSAFEPPAPNNR